MPRFAVERPISVAAASPKSRNRPTRSSPSNAVACSGLQGASRMAERERAPKTSADLVTGEERASDHLSQINTQSGGECKYLHCVKRIIPQCRKVSHLARGGAVAANELASGPRSRSGPSSGPAVRAIACQWGAVLDHFLGGPLTFIWVFPPGAGWHAVARVPNLYRAREKLYR